MNQFQKNLQNAKNQIEKIHSEKETPNSVAYWVSFQDGTLVYINPRKNKVQPLNLAKKGSLAHDVELANINGMIHAQDIAKFLSERKHSTKPVLKEYKSLFSEADDVNMKKLRILADKINQKTRRFALALGTVGGTYQLFRTDSISGARRLLRAGDFHDMSSYLQGLVNSPQR